MELVNWNLSRYPLQCDAPSIYWHVSRKTRKIWNDLPRTLTLKWRAFSGGGTFKHCDVTMYSFFLPVPFLLAWNTFCFHWRSHLCGFLPRPVLLFSFFLFFFFAFRSLPSALFFFADEHYLSRLIFFTLTLFSSLFVSSLQIAQRATLDVSNI